MCSISVRSQCRYEQLDGSISSSGLAAGRAIVENVLVTLHAVKVYRIQQNRMESHEPVREVPSR